MGTFISLLVVKHASSSLSPVALWFITLQVYYAHRAALMIDPDFQSTAGSFSSFIRFLLDCKKIHITACLKSKLSSHVTLVVLCDFTTFSLPLRHNCV